MPTINILFIGDIVGKPGMDLVQTWLPGLIQKYKADFAEKMLPKEKAVLTKKATSFLNLEFTY